MVRSTQPPRILTAAAALTALRRSVAAERKADEGVLAALLAVEMAKLKAKAARDATVEAVEVCRTQLTPAITWKVIAEVFGVEGASWTNTLTKYTKAMRQREAERAAGQRPPSGA